MIGVIENKNPQFKKNCGFFVFAINAKKIQVIFPFNSSTTKRQSSRILHSSQ